MPPSFASGHPASSIASVMTDSMIRTYFSGYDIATWKWYLPLTAPFVPWAMWSAIRKSQVSARGQAAELVEKVRQIVTSSEQR